MVASSSTMPVRILFASSRALGRLLPGGKGCLLVDEGLVRRCVGGLAVLAERERGKGGCARSREGTPLKQGTPARPR